MVGDKFQLRIDRYQNKVGLFFFLGSFGIFLYILMDSSGEIDRLVGEVSESQLISFLKDNGGIDEV